MALVGQNKITIDEFYKLRQKSDALLEFIDGLVYMSPSPSTKH
ncbi:hypothetical protein SAMN02745163_02679 [Clostridium cavendishii DSM 21758]|uniref:Uma2 family endonuclease n=1 Tax=Clostridium cavendishii DSM 21758 TaxID=1121302 RepID=A0A1M6ML22_9CLOT|nr:hypothetical protein [Clostridium cavendishii]SHJ84171.1 hypothetical protein SAMN02745163_02679 [Clostridium cavendishii DSM 21758]